jgi:hypothetical protein
MVRKRLTPDGRLEKQTLRCEHRDLILTPKRLYHKRVRPPVGVVKSLGYFRRGPVGLLHTQKVGIKYKKPTKAPAARRRCILPHFLFGGGAEMALTFGEVRV